MKKHLFVYFYTLAQTLCAQSNDSTRLFIDSTYSTITTNSFVMPATNFESLNNSFITGSAIPFVRNQNNPRITIDEIPANPIVFVNLPYKDFIGYPHLLSYDIEAVELNTFSTESKITSGRFNNSLSLSTKHLRSEKTQAKFFANNFSSSNFQQADTLGYSIINNAGVEKQGAIVSYRLSLTNGYHDSYIPYNGLKRNSGNFKILLAPFEKLSITGFVDYSSFRDYKRNQLDHFHVDRVFAYLNIRSQLSNHLEIYGRASVNNSNEDINFHLKEDYKFVDPSTQTPYFTSEHYSYSADYVNKSNFYEGGIQWNFLKGTSAVSTAELGFNHQKVADKNAIMDQSEWIPRGPFSRNTYESAVVTVENKIYANINLQRKHFSFRYLMDVTGFHLNGPYARRVGDDTYSNYKIDAALKIFKSSTKNLNDLQINATYARISNISLAPNLTSVNAPKNNWVNRNASNNYEISLDVAAFKSKLYLTFASYLSNWNNLRDIHYSSNWEYLGVSGTVGDVVKSGIEVCSYLSIIERKDLSWTMRAAVSKNVYKFTSIFFLIEDLSESNIFFTGANKLRYKNFLIQVLLEGKEGMDFNYHNRTVGAGYAIPLQHSSPHVLGVHNNGKAVYNDNPAITVPITDYIMLKDLALQYNLETKRGPIDQITIGLTFTRIRSIFPHLNDIQTHMTNNVVQTPSFYNTLSLSTGIIF